MAKWTAESTSTLQGAINPDTTDWRVYQDETPFLEQAKLDREQTQKKDVGYKKFATIPDIVAIEILSKYGIDIHSPDFMHNKDMIKKVMYIVRTEYSHLMSY